MKVGIVCTQQRVQEGETLLELLSSNGIGGTVLGISSDWEGAVAAVLASHTHFMALLNGESFPDWFQFLAGFCLGSQQTLLVSSAVDLPPHLKALPSAGSSADVYAFWLKERKEWLAAEEIRLAKEALIRAGFAIHNEDFCRVVAEGELETAQLFLKAGISANAANARGVPALSLAVRGGHQALILLLLQKGGTIDTVSADRGNTALMDAAAAADYSAAKVLIKAGAGLDLRSKNGQTALILAVGQKSFPVAELLIRAGADCSIRDSLGMSAYDYAKLLKHQELLNLMTSCVNRSGE